MKRTITALFLTFIVAVSITSCDGKYERALKQLEKGNYEKGYALLAELGKDDEIAANKRERAEAYMEAEEYDQAYTLYEDLHESYKVRQSKRDRAAAFLDADEYEEAYLLYEELDEPYKIQQNKLERAAAFLEVEEYEEAYALYEEIGKSDMIHQNKRDRAELLFANGAIDEGLALLDADADADLIKNGKLLKAKNLLDAKKDDEAFVLLDEIGEHTYGAVEIMRRNVIENSVTDDEVINDVKSNNKIFKFLPEEYDDFYYLPISDEDVYGFCVPKESDSHSIALCCIASFGENGKVFDEIFASMTYTGTTFNFTETDIGTITKYNSSWNIEPDSYYHATAFDCMQNYENEAIIDWAYYKLIHAAFTQVCLREFIEYGELYGLAAEDFGFSPTAFGQS